MNVVPSVWIPYPRPTVSVELRCGVLYSGCQCTKRNGLQQDCPRSECQGRPSCLDYPAPTCVPSGNAPRPYLSPSELQSTRDSHLDRYGRVGDHYIKYKRKLDRKYLDLGKTGYVQHPGVSARDNIPCRVHRRE
ncbi:uncharacterized protein LOC124356325 [Homalodisca vitripennis]|uniref:uncharacterized protein LOC124356325 n=1 Tax=Homalodisca vitripennis TaxID=197043 RepID=UPI001EEB1929|nr:uncharacterized protein LOC124356325 [Homalodisca vitripennis]